MFISDFYIAIFIGLTISLIFSERFGIVPGGIIVPGYLALVFDTPLTVVLVFLISIIAYYLTKFIIPKFVILYGRRRFVATLIISITLKLLFEILFPIIPFMTYEFRGIGVIVPALIANCYHKQGVKLTAISTFAISLVSFILLSIVYLI